MQDGLPGSLRFVISNALPFDTVQLVTVGTHVLTQGEIVLSRDVTITGIAPNQSAISGGDRTRLFSIPEGVSVSFDNLTSRTIANNRAGGSSLTAPPERAGMGGGIFQSGAARAYLRNVLIGGNTVSGSTNLGPDLSGSFVSGGHNVVGEIQGAGMIVNGVNEDQLGGLTAKILAGLRFISDYGGPVLTMALTPSSPAFDAGDNTLTGRDAWGFPRRAGRQVDVGAFELELDQCSPPVAPREEWQPIGEASLQYEFADPDGVGQPVRFYQLEWR